MFWSDAAEFVLANGGFLGPDGQAQLAERISGRWSTEAKKAIRGVLNDERTTPREKIEQLTEVADTFGLSVTPIAKPLVPIDRDDVRLVAWMAVAHESSGD
ncbi:MAG: hypothetical protein ACYDHP_08740 [Ferrimicrobium sp.]